MKKLITIITAVLMSLSVTAFAQKIEPAKESGLTDKDIKAFVENYEKLNEEIMELNISIEDSDTPAMMLEKLKANKQLDTVLKNNGISGGDRPRKFLTLIFGMSYLNVKDTLDTNPEAIKQLEQAGTTKEAFLAQFDALIAKKDKAILEKNMSVFIEKFKK